MELFFRINAIQLSIICVKYVYVSHIYMKKYTHIYEKYIYI